MTGNFRKGGDASTEAAAKAGGGAFAKVNYLSIKDGEQVVLRYLTDYDDLIFVDQHASVPTKPAPKGNSGNWPESMPAVCRKDPAFDYGEDCYICNSGMKNKWGKPLKATVRDWALAVLREEVIGTQEMADAGQIEEAKVGKRIGYRDATREVEETDDKGEKTGKTHHEMAIVVVNMAPGNYFDGLGAVYSSLEPEGDYPRTMCDRDMIVKRKGEGTDTDYFHIPLNATPLLRPGTEKWAKYDQAVKDQNIDLGEIISEKASDEYYARFFDPSKTAPERGGDKKDGGSSSAPEATEKDGGEPDDAKLEEMRNRIRGGGGKPQEKSKVAAAPLDVD